MFAASARTATNTRWWCPLLAVVAVLSTTTFVRVVMHWARRVLRRDRVDDLGQECERMATTAMRLIGDVAGDHPPNGWHPLHVELAGLEARATGEANATRKPERQRSLDHLAGALISLRTALLVGARLRDDITTPTVLRDAADDIVTVRCEDLGMSARELGGPSG